MNIQQLPMEFCVCRLSSMDGPGLPEGLFFLAKTEDEISLVCEAGRVPENATAVQPGFSAFKLCGVLDFDLIGIIAGIAGVLAKNRISIFVVSTYNTDYFLVKSAECGRASRVLERAGYRIIGPGQTPAAQNPRALVKEKCPDM